MNEGFDNNYVMSQNGGEGGKGMAIASMVLGIISIVLCCLWYVGPVAGIIAIVLGIVHNKKNGKCGMAVAGIVCGIVGIVLTVALLIFAAVIGVAALESLSALEAMQ